MRIGTMQGRLLSPVAGRIQCFPRGKWQDEFFKAADAGLDCIEWIYDEYGSDANPLATDPGIEQILNLSRASGISVLSLCADYFMDRPLVRASPTELETRTMVLLWLLSRCERAGIRRIVLPFVDDARIETTTEFNDVVRLLEVLLVRAERHGVEIHLETSLKPEVFAELLGRLSHPLLKANYDSGNSASLGYNPEAEFAAYGHRVGSVHIKDRVLGARTVPLGNGNADFSKVFACLRTVSYAGDFILQAARGEPGKEVEWSRHNREFVLEHLRLARLGGNG